MAKTIKLPSLEGWRAVSIILVLGSHCHFLTDFPIGLESWYNWCFDGVLGVRCFFVISGFLITYLLLEEHKETGSISLRRFYIRRALRILPVFFAFLGVVLLFQLFFPQAALSPIGIGNVTVCLWGPRAFTHLWSLAVEEQFYLLWPCLLVMIGLKRQRSVWYILGIPLLVAPLWRVVTSLKIAPAMFQMLFDQGSFFNHFDTLAIGCIAAILYGNHEPQISAILGRAKWQCALLGLGLIVIPHVLSRLNLAAVILIPLGFTLQAAGFAILLLQSILFPQMFQPLNWPAIRTLGILSYSIYIWQQICWAKGMDSSMVWYLLIFKCLLTAMVVATLSYYGFEKPLLSLRARFREAGSEERAPQPTPGPMRWF